MTLKSTHWLLFFCIRCWMEISFFLHFCWFLLWVRGRNILRIKEHFRGGRSFWKEKKYVGGREEKLLRYLHLFQSLHLWRRGRGDAELINVFPRQCATHLWFAFIYLLIQSYIHTYILPNEDSHFNSGSLCLIAIAAKLLGKQKQPLQFQPFSLWFLIWNRKANVPTLHPVQFWDYCCATPGKGNVSL